MSRIAWLTRRFATLLLLLFSLMVWTGVAFSLVQCLFPALHAFYPVKDFACADISPFDCIPLIVALLFWIAGGMSWYSRQPTSIIAFFLTGSLALAAGLLSSSDIWSAGNLFYIALAGLSPLTLHFHLVLAGRPFRALGRFSILVFYLLGVLLALPFFILPYGPDLHPFFLAVRMLFMAAALWTCLLLITSYNSFTSLSSRRRIRLVAFSTLFAFAPLVLLSVLPQTLRIAFVSFSGTFPGLLTIPIAYSYVTFRTHIPLTEKRFRQVWVYYLLFITLLSIYHLVAGLLQAILAQQAWVYTGGVSAILMIVLFLPLRALLNRLVMWIFYGSETDYAQAVHFLGERLSVVIERADLQSLLLEELVAAVRPTRALLFLRHPDGLLSMAGANGMEDPAPFQYPISSKGELAKVLTQAAGPLETVKIQVTLLQQGSLLQQGDQPAQVLSASERRLIEAPGIALWLPMVSESCLYGLLLFGFRAGDDRFTEEDQRLLGSLMRHAGAAIRNVSMAENLRAGQEELALANQKLILSQEQERRRLARELHDDTVQQLLGISFRLAGLRKRAAKNPPGASPKPLADDLELARRDLLDVVSQLRGMIGELRPAGLDELGLTVALEGYVEQLRKQSEPRSQSGLPEVDLRLDEASLSLPETSSICIFRVAQEALRNAFQHSQAAQISLRLACVDHQARLTIQDNGRGFVLPDRLSEFTQANHYGLVGMLERVRAAGGELSINSAPGQGACLTAVLPFEERSNG